MVVGSDLSGQFVIPSFYKLGPITVNLASRKLQPLFSVQQIHLWMVVGHASVEHSLSRLDRRKEHSTGI